MAASEVARVSVDDRPKGSASAALASRICGDGAQAQQQPLLERRILFHPARNTFSPLPPGIEPLNQGFDSSDAKATKRSREDANAGPENPQKDEQKVSSKQRDEDLMLDWGAPLKVGAGLNNLGNTCFLNSVLQCLTYTPPLARFLESGQHKASCKNPGFCALCALEGHVKNALRSWGKVISPSHLVKNLRSISRAFQPWRQEDAHEYLRYLLEALHKACLNKTPSKLPEHEKSLMSKIFGGRLRSQVRCTVCQQCSDTVDPFLDLSLDIMRADSLGKALAGFTSNEILDGDNKYNCAKCNKKVRAIKRFTIETAPNVLTIQFKRFSGSGLHGQKIDKKVNFNKTLDLKPFMSNARDAAVYELYGVLVHAGHSTRSGHYYCFIRTSSDIWHIMDDTRVRQVSEQSVLDQKAYILFYIRKPKVNKFLSSKPATAAAGALKSAIKEKGVGCSSVAADTFERTLHITEKDIPSLVLPETQAPEVPTQTSEVAVRENAEEAQADVMAAQPSNVAAADVASIKVTAQSCKEPGDVSSCKGGENFISTALPEGEGAKMTTKTKDSKVATGKKVKNGTVSRLSGEENSAAFAIEAEHTAEVPKSVKVTTLENEDLPNKSRKNSKSHDSPRKNGKSHKSLQKDGKFQESQDNNDGKSQESPKKRYYMKLLRAMPKNRRSLISKALDIDIDAEDSPSSSKRRKLMEDNNETKLNKVSETEYDKPKTDYKQKLTSSTSEEVRSSPAEAPAERISQPVGTSNSGEVSRNELFGSGVARWEGVDGKEIDRFLRAEHKSKPRRLDEWDEEYDRGKVKKVRRNAVGGRLNLYKSNESETSRQNGNPFQVLSDGKHN